MDQFITVAKFNLLADAHTLASLLNAEGIDTYLRDETTMSSLPLHGIAIGGVRLQIKAEDWQKAKPIVDEYNTRPASPTEVDEDLLAEYWEENDFCPNCNTNPVYRKKIPLLKFLLSAILIIPIFLHKKLYYCAKCEHMWKQ